MAFEFGMFHEFQRTAAMTDEDAFAVSFEQVDAAERWGLDAMWLAEIHVAPERSVCSAPLTLASAIAARTKRMKIGTAVQVLPLCHPLRLAEEAATVDQISHGRLIFGVGRSGFPRTYEALWRALRREPRALCRNPRYSLSRLDPAVVFLQGQVLQLRQRQADPEALPTALAGDPRRCQQRRHLSSDRQARPWGVCRGAAPARSRSSNPTSPPIRKAWKEAGHPGEGKVFLRAPVYIAETDQAAREEPEESIMYFLPLSRRAARRFGDPRRRAGGSRIARPAPAAADHQL